MPLDPSIILGARQPEAPDLLGMAVKGATLKSLMQEQQIRGQGIADDQAMRSAYRNNLEPGPDGLPTLNRSGLLGDLAISNPAAVPGKIQEFATQDANKADLQMKVMKDHIEARQMGLNNVPTSNEATPEEQQASWADHVRTMKGLGLDTSMYPAQYPGDQHANAMRTTLMSAKDKLEQQNKQTAFNQKDQELAIQKQGQAVKGQELALALKKNDNENMEKASSALQSSRGQPDVARALLNRQSAQNLDKIFEQAPGGDLNKLPIQLIPLVGAEAGKMAIGGVPDQSVLKEVTPDGARQKFQKAIADATNTVRPGEAGPQLQLLRDYTRGIAKNADDTINQNATNVLGAFSGILTTKQLEQLRRDHVNRPSIVNQSGGEGKYMPSAGEAAAELQRRQKAKSAGNG